MSTKSHIHKRCEALRKILFSTRGYAEIHIQRSFFDNKEGIKKNCCIENPNGEHMLWCVVYLHDFIFFQKIKILIFGGISKNPITKWNRSCVPKIPKFHIWNSQSFRG
jgi:hypothetical protein